MSGLPVLVNLAKPRGEADPVAVARAARDSGLAGVGLADSPRLFPDPLVTTARVLELVPDVLAGPCVLSLPLQHTARAASAIATLAGSHPGRVVAVVGRGESSLANEGLAPPSMRSYSAMLAELREGVSAEGDLVLLGAASGPRTIRSTARELGGVLVDVGTHPGAVAAARSHALNAAPEAAVWAFVRMTVTDQTVTGPSAGTALLGSCAARIARAPQWYGIDDQGIEGIAELAAAHDYTRHGTTDALHVAQDRRAALEQAALLVADRFIAAGPMSDLAGRLAQLSRTGVDGVILAGGLPGVLDRLPELGAAAQGLQVVPRQEHRG